MSVLASNPATCLYLASHHCLVLHCLPTGCDHVSDVPYKRCYSNTYLASTGAREGGGGRCVVHMSCCRPGRSVGFALFAVEVGVCLFVCEDGEYNYYWG